ncbi:MAG: hypothetical protein ACOX1T_04570 [Saccharofermentanales bacterium]|jgi:predicted homoserine dehydrogenase-like protein
MIGLNTKLQRLEAEGKPIKVGQDVSKDQVIIYDMVELEDTFIRRLRQQQNELVW